MGVLTGLTAAKVGQLSASQIRALAVSDIARMTTSQLPGLTASQLMLFSAAQLAGFSKTQIAYLSISALGGLTAAQIALLTAAQVSGFTAAQIAALSLTQIGALSAVDIAALSTTQIGALTAAQVAALNTTQLTSLSATDIAALSTLQVKALTTAQLTVLTTVQLSGLSAADIAVLSPAQIASLNVKDIAALTNTQLKGITADQLGALTSAQLKTLAAAQIGAFTTAALVGFTGAQLSALTMAQLAGLTAKQIAALSLPQMASLTATQMAALTTTQLVGLTATQIAALSSPQVASLSATQIASLSAAQIQGLTVAQFGGLTNTQFGALTGTQIGALTTADIHALSSARVGSMTAAQIAGLSASQIGALSAAQLGSLNINYDSMLGILQADAAGGMTADKFGALQALAAKFNAPGGILVSNYVQQIADNVILGNAANATWTGGTSHSITLGNLTAASTQTQVSELIGKWFLGTDLPSSSVTMSGVPNFTVSYSTVANPLFGKSGPSMSDVNQGFLGDCYVLAPLAEMAAQDPLAIQSMITANGNDTYSVCFTVGGKADYVTVENKLADGGHIFNYGTNDWASLIEQAYAQLQAGGALTGDHFTYGNSFSSIGNGGHPETTLEEITGASTIIDFAASGSTWSSYTYTGASLTIPNSPNSVILQSSTSGLSDAVVQAMVVADLAAGDNLILSSRTNAVDNSGKTTLVANHAMSIYGFDSSTGMLEIYNPWGTSSGSGQYWDTKFEVGLSNLLAAGDTISIATNAPATSVTPGSLPTLAPAGSLAGSTATLFQGLAQPFANSLGLAAAVS
jgi:hypothetical protein